jgi:Protein of unknown function (DUF2971)
LIVAEPGKPSPGILYHYTGIEPFRSILESRKMRATRYDQMNDWSELQLGVQLLREAVESHQVPSEHKEYKEFLLSAIHAYGEGVLNVYALSFSEEADSLYQWRAYAPQGGVAIGFDLEKVQKGFLCDITRKFRPDPNNRLIRCRYTDRQGRLDLGSHVAEHFFKENSYPAIFASQQPGTIKWPCPSLSVAIYRTISSIKHGAYAQEREWRSVNFLPDPNDYPVKLSETYRPYIEMEFDPKEYITEVWISPHGDRKAGERAVTYFKDRDELPVTIRTSDIPFRG